MQLERQHGECLLPVRCKDTWWAAKPLQLGYAFLCCPTSSLQDPQQGNHCCTVPLLHRAFTVVHHS